MNNIKDFIIEGTKLIEYTGNDKEVYIPDGITTIAKHAFFAKENVESIFMPDSVTELETGAIDYMQNLKKVKLSTNLKVISWGNFNDCDSIEIVDFLENIEEIEGCTFSGTNLKKVYIPSSVKKICGGAFATQTDSSRKIEVVLDKNNKHFVCKDNCIFSKDMKTLIRCFPAGRIKKFIVPDSVETIGSFAFEHCFYRQIEMNDNVENLGRYAFASCEKLKEIRLSEKITIIPEGAFILCNNLEKINIPTNTKEIQGAAFAVCSSINEIILPDNIQKINSGAFHYSRFKIRIQKNNRYTVRNDCLIDKRKKEILKYLGEAVVDENVFHGIKLIGGYAFESAEIVSELHIPENIEVIEKSAFESCTGIEKVWIPSSVKVIDSGIFDYSTIKEITIAEGVTQIENCALTMLNNFKKITIPESVTKIEKYAFEYDSKATIYCKENTRAHRFAKENKIKFKILPND